jgi:hypothetical protein
MKQRMVLATFLLISCNIFGQDLTGIWRGYFYASVGPYKEYYKYEVQIDQLKKLFARRALLILTALLSFTAKPPLRAFGFQKHKASC